MSAPAKFLFDVDFAGPAKPKSAEPTIAVAAHEAALAVAEAAAYRAGVAAGVAEADQRGAAALAAMANQLGQVAGQLTAIEQRLEAEAVEVALAISRKLCPELIAREPVADIAAMVSECLTHLVGAPHLVVRVAEHLHEVVRERVQEIAARQGFDGRMVILGDPGLRAGDCRLEWADGGMARDLAVVESEIAEAVARYVQARRSASTESVGRPDP